MIDLVNLTKIYQPGAFRRGPPVRALSGLNLHIPAGSALGVVGLNGAGKSTLMRLLLGYARPSDGSVTVAGLEPRGYAERYGISYIPERVTIPPGWTVRGAMRAYAMFAGAGARAWEDVEAAVRRLGLDGLLERRIATLSKGNLQRLALAQAILAPRKVMVLDEPTDGLDPVWIAELRAILEEWRHADAERILIIASHNLAEVERLTTRAILLHNGELRGEFRCGDGATPLEPAFLGRIAELEEARA